MGTGSGAASDRLLGVRSGVRQVFAEAGLKRGGAGAAWGAMSGGKQARAPVRHPGVALWGQGGTEGAGCRIHSLLPAACEGAASLQKRKRREAEPLRQREREDGRGLGHRTAFGEPPGLPAWVRGREHTRNQAPAGLTRNRSTCGGGGGGCC